MTKPAPFSERTLWFMLLAASLVARLVGLGHRAMSHDESLHALYSWYLSANGNYQHDPMMHGPLLFHLNAFVYLLFGANDFTARIVPALAGTGCVAMLLLYRRWLGKAGALAAAALVSLSPDLLYYSRYIRNDIYICLFTLLMVWAILRYREEQQPRHLLWIALGLGLSFACKEVCFIHGTVLGAACVFFGLLDVWKTKRLAHPLFDCAALLLLLALPFASALVHPRLGWDPLDNKTPEGQNRIFAIALIFFGLAFSAGLAWFVPRKRLHAWLLSFALFWGVNILLYTTLFSNVRHGLASGIAGSLGYWLKQHDVQRGSDDPWFYVTLLLIYTPILLVTLPAALRRFRDFPTAFLLFYAAGNLAIYSWAGERMPWLVNHITLPLCLLAGPVLADLFAPARRSLRLHLTRAGAALLLLHFGLNSLRANGPLAESYFEPLVYAHAGPDVKTAVDLIHHELAQRPDMWVQINPDFAWPLAWYFRETKASYDANTSPAPSNSAAILVHPTERDRLSAIGWIPRLEVDLVVWPRQHWHKLIRKNFISLWKYPAVRRKLLRFYLTRDQPALGPGEWPGPNRFLLMTRDPAAPPELPAP